MITASRAMDREQLMLFPDAGHKERAQVSRRWDGKDLTARTVVPAKIVVKPVLEPADGMYLSYFDGGCSGNGRAVCSGYGSFTGREGKVFRRQYGVVAGMTNNVAEIQTAIEALQYWLVMIEEPGKARIILVGDSQLTVNCLMGRWRLRKPHLAKLKVKFDELKERFLKVELRWVRREKIVPILGH